ncbi:hypothetical protein DM826_01860 [Halonotius aquaticus]|uniref:Uncharacterized protein n=1 Tax=Halonotius aquaticus TaxID=2216978 RepID=A0A3A6PT89_9EURY|nr:hypothetical protein DM826_01860 [Halonotius aquaticus]
MGTLAAGVATALGGCAASETALASEPTYIASLSTEQRANPRVVDLLVELVEDHGATRLVVVTESGNSVFQTQLRPEQRFVRVPLEDGVDAILHPIATVESLDHELVLYDGETELTRRPWQPTIDLDYELSLENNSSVDIVNSIELTLQNNSDIRMRPLRAYIDDGFLTTAHEVEQIGQITPTTPTWARGWERTYLLVADQPAVGSNLLSPPGRECFSEPQTVELVIEYEQPITDRLSIAMALAGDPRLADSQTGNRSVYCSQPTIESWELVEREISA